MYAAITIATAVSTTFGVFFVTITFQPPSYWKF